MMTEYKKDREARAKWASGLKVGDEVALRNSRFGSSYQYRFEKVVKITKQHGGTIFVGSDSFDFFGNIRGRSGGYNHTEMIEITQEVCDEDETSWIRGTIRSYFLNHRDELSLTALRLIQTVIEQYPLEKKR